VKSGLSFFHFKLDQEKLSGKEGTLDCSRVDEICVGSRKLLVNAIIYLLIYLFWVKIHYSLVSCSREKTARVCDPYSSDGQ